MTSKEKKYISHNSKTTLVIEKYTLLLYITSLQK